MPQGRVWQTVRSGGEARSDPFQLLVAEHELLRAQLRRAQTGAHRADVQRLADAARTHMHRESRALHPMCERLFGGPDGAVAVMREDHDAMQAELRSLEHAATDGDRGDIMARLEAFAAHLEEHLAREERVLFPLMAALLSGTDAARLADRLRVVARDP